MITDAPNTVFLFTKKTCPRCSATRSMVENKVLVSLLEFEEVLAEEPNLEECKDLGIVEVPSVIININGSLSGPFCEPTQIAEKITYATNIARRAKEKEAREEKSSLQKESYKEDCEEKSSNEENSPKENCH